MKTRRIDPRFVAAFALALWGESALAGYTPPPTHTNPPPPIVGNQGGPIQVPGSGIPVIIGNPTPPHSGGHRVVGQNGLRAATGRMGVARLK